LQLGSFSNALVDIPLVGLANIGDSRPVDLPPETRVVTLMVHRAGPGAITVPLTVLDNCGSWPTFVGGGPSAF
jgi:hypothetical protein